MRILPRNLRIVVLFLLLCIFGYLTARVTVADWDTDFDPPDVKLESLNPPPTGDPPKITANSVTFNFSCYDQDSGCGEGSYTIEYFTDASATTPSYTLSGPLNNPALESTPEYLAIFYTSFPVRARNALPHVVVTYTAKDHAGNAAISDPDATYTFDFDTTGSFYNISGYVFVDTNKDEVKNGVEGGYTGGTSTLTFTDEDGNETPAETSTGLYAIDLLEGTYTAAYTSLPTGYKMTYPINISPPSFTVTIGTSCDTAGHNSAACSGGSITDLNFGITNSNIWCQCIGGDCRNICGPPPPQLTPTPTPTTAPGDCSDPTNRPNGCACTNDSQCNSGNCGTGGTCEPPGVTPTPTPPGTGGVDDPIPPTASNQCNGPFASVPGPNGTSPGIIFSSSGTPNFGSGSPSDVSNGWGWLVRSPFSTALPGVIRTSYDYVLTSLRQSGQTTFTQLCVSQCDADGVNACNLSATLPTGIYQSGNLTLTGTGSPSPLGRYTFPKGGTFLFLVNGDLHVNTEIIVPNGTNVF